VTLGQVFLAVVLIGLLLLVSQWICTRVRVIRVLFLPASIIAGTIALLLGPQVLGGIVTRAGDEQARLAEGVFPEAVLSAWAAMPGLLINVVFAALFLGKLIPGIRDIWQKAGPQVVFGQTVAWGQYVIGILLAIFVLHPVYGLPHMVGALIEIGFEGGHGTAAGLGPQFEELGFAEGQDLALGMATIGIVMGVIIGTILINWAARTGQATVGQMQKELEQAEKDVARFGPAGQPSVDVAEPEDQPTDPLSVHLGIVAMAIAIGWILHQGLIWSEIGIRRGLGYDEQFMLMAKIPLFPLAMIGGVIIQVTAARLGLDHRISRRLMNRISGTALDFTIVAALATLSLTALGEHLVPFLLLAGAGMAWCVFAVLVIAPRLIPYGWFERGIGDFGQSMGVTVTGLLLMRVADPQNRTGALESFGYKQLLFEPVVGGGLFTATSMVLIFQLGPWWVLGITAGLLAFFLIFGFTVFGPLAKAERAAGR
jgi:glutamate:Na+ symporter, ESS family